MMPANDNIPRDQQDQLRQQEDTGRKADSEAHLSLQQPSQPLPSLHSQASVAAAPHIEPSQPQLQVWKDQMQTLAKVIVSIHVHSQSVYQRLGLIAEGSSLPSTKILDLVQVRPSRTQIDFLFLSTLRTISSYGLPHLDAANCRPVTF